jgi:hypothetical protein
VNLILPEAAAWLRISESTLRKLGRQGTGPPRSPVGRKWIYRLEDVERWMDERREQPAEATES